MSDLQTIFYLVAILYFGVMLVLVIGTIIFLFILKRRFERIKRNALRPAESAIDLSASFILAIINRAKTFVKRV